jgi:hypothetical protein
VEIGLRMLGKTERVQETEVILGGKRDDSEVSRKYAMVEDDWATPGL